VRSRLARPGFIALLFTVGASTVSAIPALAAPTVGSGNTAVADPPIAVPATAPCVVPLFAGVTFADFSPKPFAFAPPAGCSGPWEKVVLAADFAVTAGRQFDRTASIWIGGANVYFGTTSEPSAAVARSWHIENDLTDYSPLFGAPQAGMVQLDNLVNGTFTGILSGAAELRFYPVAAHHKPPVTADLVLPLSAGPTGGTVALATTADRLARTFTLPTNVERAVLDVYAQSQSGDEFWYTCVPDDLTGPLQSCGATAFRETEIAIDGVPAGVAPIYPWLYTGAIDPNLWKPIPSVQTLSFTPYRVDLTPFAAVLSDGAPHEIAVSVFNANNHFATTASLLIYRDAGRAKLRGKLTANTLTAVPAPVLTTNIVTAADGAISGPVDITSSRAYKITGFVDTSHGRVTTEVTAKVKFANHQQFEITAATYHQHIAQTTTIVARSQRRGGGLPSDQLIEMSWPLTVDFAFAAADDGTAAQTTTIDQTFQRAETAFGVGGRLFDASLVINRVAPSDTLHFDANGAFTGSTGQVSAQHYLSLDTRNGCFSRDVTAAAGVVTAVVDGQACGH
jgi:hypothetical protein